MDVASDDHRGEEHRPDSPGFGASSQSECIAGTALVHAPPKASRRAAPLVQLAAMKHFVVLLIHLFTFVLRSTILCDYIQM